jgi:hypothetical protein
MPTQIIPLRSLPNQKLNIVLDGQNCVLRVYWRERLLFP